MQNAKKTQTRITASILILLAILILVFYPQNFGAGVCFFIVGIGYLIM